MHITLNRINARGFQQSPLLSVARGKGKALSRVNKLAECKERLRRTAREHGFASLLGWHGSRPGFLLSSCSIALAARRRRIRGARSVATCQKGTPTSASSARAEIDVQVVVIYFIALSTIKLTVKLVYLKYGFVYPKFVTALHMLASALVGFLILLHRRLTSGFGFLVPTGREVISGIVPIGAAFACTLACNNMALLLCSASFTEIIGATTPIVTIGFVVALGLPFDLNLLGPVFLIVVGCVLAAAGELHFSFAGAVLCMLANVARAFRSSLQEKMMTRTGSRFDPPTLLAWTCMTSSIIMICSSLATEGRRPWLHLLHEPRWIGLWLALFASCVNAGVLNLAQLFMTKGLGAVGSQILAQSKSIITVLGGIMLFGETFSKLEWFGFAWVLLGTALFAHLQRKSRTRLEGKQ